jgi:hypothetical protein
VLPNHKLYIQPQLEIVLLFNSTNMCHGRIGSSRFWQLGLALFSKHIILKKALEYEQIAQDALKNMKFFKRQKTSFEKEEKHQKTLGD